MSHSVDDTYDVYETSYPKAVKEHRCDACGRTVHPGEVYARVSIVFDGQAETVKRCGGCEEMHQHLRDLCLDRGDMWPDERLACGLAYEGEWERPPPAEIAALAFASSAEASQLAEVRRDRERKMLAERRRVQTEQNAKWFAIHVLGFLLFGLPLNTNPFSWEREVAG